MSVLYRNSFTSARVFYVSAKSLLSSGLSLVAGLIPIKKVFFKDVVILLRKTPPFSAAFFSALSFSLRGKIFLAQLYAHLRLISKHLVLYSISILFPCDVLDQARVLNSPASGLRPYLSVGS